MTKLDLFASITAIFVALGIATVTPSSADAVPLCRHTDFKTEMVKNACAKGNQPAAKKAMQDWVKTVKIDGKTPTCSASFCHKNLAPDYELNPDAFDKFKKAGGKMLDAK